MEMNERVNEYPAVWLRLGCLRVTFSQTSGNPFKITLGGPE